MDKICDNCKKGTRKVEYTAVHVFKTDEVLHLCRSCAGFMIGANSIKDVKEIKAND